MKKSWIVILAASAVLLIGSAAFILLSNAGILTFASEASRQDETAVKTFAEWTDMKAFRDIPAMIVEQGRIGRFSSEAGSCSTVDINGGSLDDYRAYLELLEQEGYTKYVDNWPNGLNGNVFNAVYTKDGTTVTVIHMKKLDKTYIAVEKTPLSDHLFYSEDYVKNDPADAKTRLHMIEMHSGGNGFVLQLKNGHFLISDGGHKANAEYLLDYLDSLTPEGETPVVEGWFISHCHEDHCGVFRQIALIPGYESRVVVDGIYFDAVNASLAGEYDISMQVMGIKDAASELKTQTGETTPVYRPHAGQTLYFDDVTVDVMLTLIEVPKEDYYRGWSGNYNERSEWLMFNIEGQKLLIAGDADFGSMKTVMSAYDQEYLDMNIMAVQHHGINVHNDFTDFIKVDTLLYPYYTDNGMYRSGPVWGGSFQASEDRNAYLQATVKEWMHYGTGGKILTFPYEVGSYENVPARPDTVTFEEKLASGSDDTAQYAMPYTVARERP
ncbi:MAG: hypothetical protein IJU18_06025 [Oscillospiraceae bacterium]|nr:hypothetical protein [Oscillospiraceae bacterium]